MPTAVRKLRVNNKASTTPAKPVKKAAKAEPKVVAKAAKAKVEVKTHTGTFHTVGASGPLRTSRKLSPVVLDRVPGTFTPRDQQFIKDLQQTHGGKVFERLNFDGGLMSRAAGAGLIAHVAGDLSAREATFKLTAKGLKA